MKPIIIPSLRNENVFVRIINQVSMQVSVPEGKIVEGVFLNPKTNDCIVITRTPSNFIRKLIEAENIEVFRKKISEKETKLSKIKIPGSINYVPSNNSKSSHLFLTNFEKSICVERVY
ncbi:MAG: hypothetical protein ACP5OG_02245 [Candidatus Nanoarchaeia archaeon]